MITKMTVRMTELRQYQWKDEIALDRKEESLMIEIT